MASRELFSAAANGDEETVRRLLAAGGVDVNAGNVQDGSSPLFVAAFWGFEKICKLLLDHGADPNVRNKGTLWTPLHAATFQEHGPVIMKFLEKDEYGADLAATDSLGRTPVDFASVSEAIWPFFAARGLKRTDKRELVEKKVIKKVEQPQGGQGRGQQGRPGGAAPQAGGQRVWYSRPGSAYVVSAHPQQRAGATASRSGRQTSGTGIDVLSGESSRPPLSSSGSDPSLSVWRR